MGASLVGLMVAWSNYLSWSEPRPPCVCRQFGILLLATTASTISPITRWRIGSHTGSRLFYVQGRLLQSTVGQSTEVCYRQVAAGHKRCSASCERHEEVRVVYNQRRLYRHAATAQEMLWVLERSDRGWSVLPAEIVEICRHSAWTWSPASYLCYRRCVI